MQGSTRATDHDRLTPRRVALRVATLFPPLPS